MKVANAIYDVVFKYLMEDKRVAKLLLSALLKMEVEDLEMQPQEYVTDFEKKTLTIFRIDFKATIRLKNGQRKLVLIELQKAKLPSDIMRFRRYLGEQYASKQNVIENPDRPSRKQALPIITIYFLGYPLENFPDRSIIRVKRKYLDDLSGEELEGTDPFIESLTHDAIIVQLSAIKNKKHRDRLERVLSVFDPSRQHEIEIDTSEYPPEFEPLIRRLIMALADDQVRKTMKIEDEILEDLAEKEREIEKLEKTLEEKKKVLAQKDKALAEKDKALAEKDKALAEKDKALDEKSKALKEMAKMLKELGVDTETIVKRTGLSREEVTKL